MAGVPTGLDFGAVMAVAEARGADPEYIADVLPDVEIAILAAMSGDADEGE